jgi:hypothetical protein
VESVSSERITALLVKWQQGDREVAPASMPSVCEELRLMVRRHLRREVGNQTFHSGTFVHEAYLKLVDQKAVLNRLSKLEPRQAQIVELRFLAVFPSKKRRRQLALHLPAVKREWAVAEAWVYREMHGTN